MVPGLRFGDLRNPMHPQRMPDTVYSEPGRLLDSTLYVPSGFCTTPPVSLTDRPHPGWGRRYHPYTRLASAPASGCSNSPVQQAAPYAGRRRTACRRSSPYPGHTPYQMPTPHTPDSDMVLHGHILAAAPTVKSRVVDHITGGTSACGSAARSSPTDSRACRTRWLSGMANRQALLASGAAILFQRTLVRRFIIQAIGSTWVE